MTNMTTNSVNPFACRTPGRIVRGMATLITQRGHRCPRGSDLFAGRLRQSPAYCVFLFAGGPGRGLPLLLFSADRDGDHVEFPPLTHEKQVAAFAFGKFRVHIQFTRLDPDDVFGQFRGNNRRHGVADLIVLGRERPSKW